MDPMQCSADDVKTDHPNEPYIASIELIEPIEPKTKEDVMDALTFLRAKFRDGADKLPSEEREKYRNVFQHIIEEFRSMEQSLTRAECNADDRVLQMVGSFPRDSNGTLRFPKKEDVQTSFLQGVKRGESCDMVEVESVFVEENYNYLLSGPSSSNYLLQEPNMYVKFKTLEQTKIVEKKIKCSTVYISVNSGRAGNTYHFTVPKQSSADRTTFRAIGNLIKRLKRVDSKLKALGAVPGRGGLPELSDMLIQTEDFDTCIKSFQTESTERMHMNPLTRKQELHAILCSRTRVDKRKRQAALEPLVDERLDTLLQLAQFDPDQYPVVIERAFK